MFRYYIVIGLVDVDNKWQIILFRDYLAVEANMILVSIYFIVFK